MGARRHVRARLDATFSDDGLRFWRILDRPRGSAYQERWSLWARRCEGVEGVELRAFRLDDPSQEVRWLMAKHCDAIALGPTRCVTGWAGGEVRVYDAAGASAAAVNVPSGKLVTAVAIARDVRRVLAGTLDGRVHLCALTP